MINRNDLWAEINALIKGLDRPWKAIVEIAFAETGEAGLEATPASSGGHQAYPLGLLEHSLEVAQVAKALCDLESNAGADRSQVIAGALLHDIGKLWSYQPKKSGGYEYTKAEATSHHIVLGIEYLVVVRIKHQAALEEAGFTLEHWEALRHIVVSHHGTRDQGALREPETVEAMIVHLADSASARLDKVRNKIAKAKKA